VNKPDALTGTETVCQFCSKPVHLELAPVHVAPAWRMFDCPYCHKTNFVLLPSRITGATRPKD
jgi:hypothetical protein